MQHSTSHFKTKYKIIRFQNLTFIPQTETKLANLEGQREIATAEMERESEVVRIHNNTNKQVHKQTKKKNKKNKKKKKKKNKKQKK